MAVKLADPIKVRETDLAGLWHLEWAPVSDDRGSVQPIYIGSQLSFAPDFVVRQTNLTRNNRGTIRGFHGEHMSKMVALLAGRVFAAIVDLRPESPTFGRHTTFDLIPNEGLFVSSGLGNGLQSISDEESLYLYLFDAEWEPGMPGSYVNPLDADVAVDWPIKDAMILSDKDRSLPPLDAR